MNPYLCYFILISIIKKVGCCFQSEHYLVKVVSNLSKPPVISSQLQGTNLLQVQLVAELIQ